MVREVRGAGAIGSMRGLRRQRQGGRALQRLAGGTAGRERGRGAGAVGGAAGDGRAGAFPGADARGEVMVAAALPWIVNPAGGCLGIRGIALALSLKGYSVQPICAGAKRLRP